MLFAAAIAGAKYDVDKRRFGLYVPMEITIYYNKMPGFMIEIRTNHMIMVMLSCRRPNSVKSMDDCHCADTLMLEVMMDQPPDSNSIWTTTPQLVAK